MSYRNETLSQKPPQSQTIRELDVLKPGSLLAKTPPPVLLNLTGKTSHPLTLSYPVSKRTQNGKTRIMKTSIKPLKPRGMDRPAVRTPVALHLKTLSQSLKISLDISMTPQPLTLTAGTAKRLRPGIIFLFFNQPLYIYFKMEYQGTVLWGWPVGACEPAFVNVKDFCIRCGKDFCIGCGK